MKGVPYVVGSETSQAAAEAKLATAKTDQLRVYWFIVARGERGATDDELEANLGLLHQNASARRRSLERDGYLLRTERKRKTRHGRAAFVYVRCPEGQVEREPLPPAPGSIAQLGLAF